MAPKSKTHRAARLTAAASSDPLREEYARLRKLFDLQPLILQRYLELQGRQIGEAISQPGERARFSLPDRMIPGAQAEALIVPPELREQHVGGLLDRLTRRDLRDPLKQRLTELEHSPEPAVALSASLIRYAAAQHLVRDMLPAGRSVRYAAAEDEEIPTIPVAGPDEADSAITAETDAIAEEGQSEGRRGSLQVPYVPAARRFYLPQWVAFDDRGRILVNTVSEAQAHLASMQRFLEILFAARSLAPYMVADEEFEKKRYGMLGQIINQGRALAHHMTREIIHTIQSRARVQSLNRGLSLSLPYFDDQDLEMRSLDFVVIPAGRIMFVPAFVVRAAVQERAKAAQDTRLSPSTRRHLIQLLSLLEEAFDRGKAS
jgi:hypothetical protein